MKKLVAFVVLVVLIISGVIIYKKTRPPESDRIRAEMQRVLYGTDDPAIKVMRFDQLSIELGSAYIDEKKYDMAVALYERKIEDIRKEGEDQKRTDGRRHSTSYAHEAAQFQMLNVIYKLAGDNESAAKAQKKADALEEKAERAKQREPKEPKKSILD